MAEPVSVPQRQDESFLPAPFNTTSPPPQLIAQGAEALLYRTHFLSPSTPAALKARPSKPYRHPTLDARLTKQRVLAEARVLVKLAGLASDPANEINVPAVLSLEWDAARKVKGLSDEQRGARSGGGAGAWLLMEWIEGRSVKDLLRQWDEWYKNKSADVPAEEIARQEEEVKRLLRRIGRAIGNMHDKGAVVHGDLTSSNIIVRPKGGEMNGSSSAVANGDLREEKDQDGPTPPDLNGEIVLIDFGLATQSIQDEDRSVDLYVLERAFGSTHPRQEDWFDAEVLQSQHGYRGSYRGSNVVLKRLEDVRLRGRKRSMIG
ncbi:serine/threonine-protein kinase bud32 [Exophiala xenobiotica]|nr:serine/threonine-protein kinase bud32 [Exophiala xenobiotica]KAK5391996.1 serine/threonine-protein kinase bud32 [Exophiala xenobiotica]KAK5442858.1 serine/threonine-protein kinase bud32 [Exophiala xenobiotica]KAK5494865.1 serine/threonine-protein kinase bud32 [Exophiala xenobiotica]KAK5507408.1 serine/threonine-protein kinase bud32 [Exophiala xenobiotica]